MLCSTNCYTCMCEIDLSPTDTLHPQSTSSGGSVTCQNRFINTEQLLLGPSEENFDNSEGGAGGSPGASVGGRRRRRSIPRSVRRKRQMQPTETVEDARDRTLVSWGTQVAYNVSG